MQYYTIKEVSEKLGVKPYRIRHLVIKKKIRSVKKNGNNSPYKIPSSEIEKAQTILGESSPKVLKVESEKKTVEQAKQEPTLQDLFEIQKTLANTMRDLASTQEKIAATLKELAGRV